MNEYLQTSVPHIYAMGDVKGGLQFTYISLDDYRIVKDHLFGNKQRTTKNRGHIAYSVFYFTNLLPCGTERTGGTGTGLCRKNGFHASRSNSTGECHSQPDGLLKAVIDTKTDQILGCVLFCAESEEVINFVQLAMNQQLTYQEVGNHIFTHPTMSEALNDLFS